MNLFKSNRIKLKTKRTFLKQGTCSRTFFHIINREFKHPHPHEENAIDPLAGGIYQQGYQCGMLWGTTMAIGTESFRRTNNLNDSIPLTIRTTQHIVESFKKKAKSIECYEITSCDFNKKWDLTKYLATGKMFTCFRLASKWAPDAVQLITEKLSEQQTKSSSQTLSCASEVVQKMGGTDEEMSMVSGFAGGLGLSGNGCGALAAAIWFTILGQVRKDGWKYSLSDTTIEKIINKFYETTNYEMECNKICGRLFNTPEEHSEFIKNGGCNKIISILSEKPLN